METSLYPDSEIPGTGRRLFKKTAGAETSNDWGQTEIGECLDSFLSNSLIEKKMP